MSKFGARTEKRVTFADARSRNECFRCGAPNWTPKHRCSKGTIVAHARNRLKNGESSVHIVADLVQQMEGDLCVSDDDVGATDTRYESASGSEVATFDALFAEDDGREGAYATGFTQPIETVDKEIYISQLAAEMEGSKTIPPGFRLGDADH